MICYKPRAGRGLELEASSLAVWFNEAGRAGLHLGSSGLLFPLCCQRRYGHTKCISFFKVTCEARTHSEQLKDGW